MTLLDTYQAERLPSARAAIDFSMELGKVICVPDPAEAAARDEAMAAASARIRHRRPGSPRISSGCIHPTAPHAGTQLVQGKDGGRWFDEMHGNGWRLLVLGVDVKRLGRKESSWFDSLGGRVVSLIDPDPLFVRWFAEHDMTCALQRPDFYLYGTAATVEEASALLADLRRHLAQEVTI